MKKKYQKKILIFGVGLSGRAVFRKLSQVNENNIVGFLDNNFPAKEKTFFNIRNDYLNNVRVLKKSHNFL